MEQDWIQLQGSREKRRLASQGLQRIWSGSVLPLTVACSSKVALQGGPERPSLSWRAIETAPRRLHLDTSRGRDPSLPRSWSAFRRVAVNCTHPVAIIITRPFVWCMTSREVGRPALIAGEFVTIESHTGWGQRLQDSLAVLFGRRIENPDAHLARLEADHLEHRWPVVLIRSPPWLVVATPSRWFVGVDMGVAFFSMF